jgi:hypothetical protein
MPIPIPIPIAETVSQGIATKIIGAAANAVFEWSVAHLLKTLAG